MEDLQEQDLTVEVQQTLGGNVSEGSDAGHLWILPDEGYESFAEHFLQKILVQDDSFNSSEHSGLREMASSFESNSGLQFQLDTRLEENKLEETDSLTYPDLHSSVNANSAAFVDFEKFKIKCSYIAFEERASFSDFFAQYKASINVLLSQDFVVHSKGAQVKLDAVKLADSTFNLIAALVYWYHQVELEKVDPKRPSSVRRFNHQTRFEFLSSILKWFYPINDLDLLSDFQYYLLVLLISFSVRFNTTKTQVLFEWKQQYSFAEHQLLFTKYLLNNYNQSFVPDKIECLPLEFFSTWSKADFNLFHHVMHTRSKENESFGLDGEILSVYLDHALKYYVKKESDHSTTALKEFMRDTINNSFFYRCFKTMNELPMFYHQIPKIINQINHLLNSIVYMSPLVLTDLVVAYSEDSDNQAINIFWDNFSYSGMVYQNYYMPIQMIQISQSLTSIQDNQWE